MAYDLLRPWLSLDDWQREYILAKDNCFLLCGRQVGKTTAMSIKFAKRAAETPNHTVLMVAFTEKQAYNLFFKTLMYLKEFYAKMICRGTKKPTKHEINLTNGSKIMCYAVGVTGWGIHGYTVNSLVMDEAAPMNREIFISLLPTISVTKGTVDMSSTPRGEEGFFYECSKDPSFKHFYVSAEDCPRHDKAFLEAEKGRMSKLEYAQEYLAVFLSKLRRLFNDEIIKRACVLQRPAFFVPGRKYYLGVDVARLGEDESTFEILERHGDLFVQVESIITTQTLTTQTFSKIKELEAKYHFRKIYIDEAGVGAGVFDFLMLEPSINRKVIAINNARKSLAEDDKQKKRLLKEDLYMNLLMLMEHKRIQLLDDDEIKASLASIQYEYLIQENKKSQFRIFGNYTHIAEGIIRAAWSIKDKTLDLWAA